MTVRAATSIIALSVVGLASAPLGAQQSISYETGEYEYAQPLPELDDDVVTETVAKPAGETVAPAARVIPARQPTPQFVSKPTIQAIDPSADEYYTYEAPIEADITTVGSFGIKEVKKYFVRITAQSRLPL